MKFSENGPINLLSDRLLRYIQIFEYQILVLDLLVDIRVSIAVVAVIFAVIFVNTTAQPSDAHIN